MYMNCETLTVRCFTFDYLSIWSQQLTRHHSKAAESLSQNIALNVTVVILCCPNEAPRRFNDLCDHVVDKAMLVVDPERFKL